MKTQRRHELETNVLAARLAVWIDRIKPYTNLILTIAIVILVVAVGAWWSFRQSYQSESEAWTDYYEAVAGGRANYDKLREVAEQYGNTPVEEWANLTMADAMLLEVSNQMFLNRTRANGLLDQIRSTCRMLQTNSQNPEIRSRASFCLARAFEMEGRLDKAKEEYEKVEGVFKPYAEQQLAAIEKPEARQFYEWFAHATPPTVSPPTGPGVPGQQPLFEPSPLGGGPAEGSTEQSGSLLPPGFGLETDNTGTENTGPSNAGSLPGESSPAGGSPAESPPVNGSPASDLFPATDENAADTAAPSPESAAPTGTPSPSAGDKPADTESPPMSDSPAENSPSPKSGNSADNASPSKQPAPNGSEGE